MDDRRLTIAHLMLSNGQVKDVNTEHVYDGMATGSQARL